MHTFGAGFDLRTKKDVLQVMEEFDRVVGIGYLRGMHLNDSMVELGSHRDRHESIGCGLIGIELFQTIMRDKRFEEMPLVLETPHPEKWPDEVKMLLQAAAR